ncbi:MAG TPA: hypothetical protein VGI57_09915 [Usitatibacter sp.]
MPKALLTWRVAAAFLLAIPAFANAAPAAGSTFDTDAFFRPGRDYVNTAYAASMAKCKQGVAADCVRLSRRIGYGVRAADLKLYDEAFKAGCAKGVIEACGASAWVRMSRAESMPSDFVDGAKDLDKSCAAGDGISCARHIELLTTGPRPMRDAPRARILASESCTKLGGYPCYSLAQMLVSEKKGALNDAHDVELRTKACDAGEGRGCVDAGVALGGTKGTELFKKGCDFEYHGACAKLGGSMMDTACKMGNVKACDDRANETQQYERYCSYWGSEACSRAAAGLAKGQGEFAPEAEKIVAMYLHAYALGDEPAKNTVLHLFKDNEVACNTDRRKGEACAFTGYGYLIGWPGVDSLSQAEASRNAKAERFLRYACDAGAANSCKRADALKAAMK